MSCSAEERVSSSPANSGFVPNDSSDLSADAAHLTMTSKDGVSKERIDYEMPFSNCSN